MLEIIARGPEFVLLTHTRGHPTVGSGHTLGSTHSDQHDEVGVLRRMLEQWDQAMSCSLLCVPNGPRSMNDNYPRCK